MIFDNSSYQLYHFGKDWKFIILVNTLFYLLTIIKESRIKYKRRLCEDMDIKGRGWW